MPEYELHPGAEQENKEIDLSQLSFDQLKQTRELAKKSYKQRGTGFDNANGNGIHVQIRNDKYKVTDCTIPEFSSYIATHPDSILQRSSADQEVMMQALREMIEELGNRIIA